MIKCPKKYIFILGGELYMYENKEEIQKKLANIKGFMLDMDGTFYLGEQLLDGSLDFLKACERTGRKTYFLTNNSSRSKKYYEEKLKRMNIPAQFINVLSSGEAAGEYVLEHYPNQKAFLLGNEILKEELLEMGVNIDQENPDFVLVAYDTTLDYDKMCKVCDFVRQGLPYIATHPDYNCPTEDGYIPDIGAIIAFIEASTDKKPDIIIGKPYEEILLYALRHTGIKKEELAMVGDRPYTDIALGINHGLTSIMVLTGEGTVEDTKNTPWKPDLLFERLSDIIPFL